MQKQKTAARILETLTQNKTPMTLEQLAHATGIKQSKIRHSAALLAKPNKIRKPLIRRVKIGVYQIIGEEEPHTETELPMTIQEQVLDALKKIERPTDSDEIAKQTNLPTQKVKDALHRLKKSTKKRPQMIRSTHNGLYQLIDDQTPKDQQAPQTKNGTENQTNTPSPEQNDTPENTGLQHPEPVPLYLPPDTEEIKDFEVAHQNIQRLWLLHKSICESLRVLENFGETIPLPQLLTDTTEAKQYTNAIGTYLTSSILYQQAIAAFEKNPINPLPEQKQQQLTEQEQQNPTETIEKKIAEPKNFTFAGENFENVEELQNTVALIKTNAPLNKPIKGTDQAILFQLLRYAPNYKEITSGGIHQFQVKLADRYNPKSRIFILIKSDGNKTTIPTTEYINRFKAGEKPAQNQT